MNVKNILTELYSAPDEELPVYVYDCESGERIPVCEVWEAMNGTVQVDEVGKADALTVREFIIELEEINESIDVMYGTIPVTFIDLSITDAVDLNIN